MKLSEKILQFIWKFRLFDNIGLKTLSGKDVIIKKVGVQNFHEGPDFENAVINIAGMEWVGNIEIHINSSDWDLHNHGSNPTYNSVILHVVNEYSREVKRCDGTIPETLVLNKAISRKALAKYEALESSQHWIACEKLIHQVEPFFISQWLNRLLIERLYDKSTYVLDLLDEFRGDWETVSYIMLARNMGFKTNTPAFESLARSLPYKLVQKYRGNPFAVEALLFGQAGFLENQTFDEDYPAKLQREYGYLRKIHKLQPIDRANWKFLRMRPSNFPTIRLAQFASLCSGINHFFNEIIEIENLNLWHTRFKSLSINKYWESHYHFTKETRARSTQIGDVASSLIMINTVAVVLFAYGKYMDDAELIDRAISFLERIKPENNSVIERYKEIGVKAGSAAESQALVQLKAKYCEQRRCLSCEIGSQIIK